ncbi:unnamed protein product [Closterium sp. NIES-53]
MIHAAAPHFLWPFAVQYAAHQINLQPRVSLPETTPTLQWTGKVGDASVLRIWGFRAFVRDTSADKLSSRAIPCVFLGFPPDASGWQFYHPTSRRVLSFQDVTFDESGPAPSGVSLVDLVEPVEVAVNSGAARGAEPAGAGPGGAEPWFGGPLGVPSRREPLSPQRLREWYARRCSCAAGAMGPSARGASRAGAAGGTAGSGADGAAGPGGAGARGTIAVGGRTSVGAAGGAGVAGPGGARSGRIGAGGAGGVKAVGARAVATGGVAGVGAPGGTGAGGAAGVLAGDLGAEGTGAVSAVLGLPPSTGPTPPLLSPPPVESQSQLQPASPLLGPSPYSGPTRGLTERRETESRPASPESRPELHYLNWSTYSASASSCCLRHSLYDSSLDPEFDSLRAAIPTVTHFLATAFTDPSFESTSASPLVAELVDFAAACRLDYAEVFECFVAALPHLVSMLLALEGDPDAPDIPTPRFYAEAIEGPYSSQLQTAMDKEMASWKSTGTYVDEVPLPGANIVSGMWIFKVKRPPGSPLVFKARCVARGFNQRQGVDLFRTFSPTLASLGRFLLVHSGASDGQSTVSARHPVTWDRAQRTITLNWSHMVQQVLQRFGFTYSSPHSTPLPTGHSLSAPPSDESVEPSGLYPELVGCLIQRKEHMDAAKRVLRYLCSTSGMGLVLGGRARVVLTGHAAAS